MPQWRVTASVATSFRVPTLYQRFSQYGNAALVPESGRNVEFGLRWASAGSEVSLNGWRNKVSNLVDFGPPGPCLDAFGCYVNIGRAELEGVTLAGRTQVMGVTLRGSLSWHDPRNAQNDRVLARRAKRLATFGAETQASGWTFGTELQAAGERVEYDFLGNAQRMGGFGLVNVFVGTQLLPGLSLAGRIDNLADKLYETARNYATAGRNVQITLRWTMP
jgi:vitamin B12 transporter